MLGNVVRQCSSKKFITSNQQRERGAELDYWGARGGVAVWSLSYLDEKYVIDQSRTNLLHRTICQSSIKITISVISTMKCPGKMLLRTSTNATTASFQHLTSQIWKCTWEDIIQKSFSNVTSATMKEISQLYWTLESNTIVISVISKQLLQVGLNVTELRNMREFLQNMLGLKIFVWVQTSPFAQILPPCILRSRFDSFMLQKFLSDSVLLV